MNWIVFTIATIIMWIILEILLLDLMNSKPLKGRAFPNKTSKIEFMFMNLPILAISSLIGYCIQFIKLTSGFTIIATIIIGGIVIIILIKDNIYDNYVKYKIKSDITESDKYSFKENLMHIVLMFGTTLLVICLLYGGFLWVVGQVGQNNNQQNDTSTIDNYNKCTVRVQSEYSNCPDDASNLTEIEKTKIAIGCQEKFDREIRGCR